MTQFEDRLSIRELYGRYSVASARKDTQGWMACWSTNAVWKTPHFELTGHAAIGQMWDATWQQFENVVPLYEVNIVSLDGDRASAESCLLEVMKTMGGGVMKLAGLYGDTIVRENGLWCFARREYMLLSQEVSPVPSS